MAESNGNKNKELNYRVTFLYNECGIDLLGIFLSLFDIIFHLYVINHVDFSPYFFLLEELTDM